MDAPNPEVLARQEVRREGSQGERSFRGASRRRAYIADEMAAALGRLKGYNVNSADPIGWRAAGDGISKLRTYVA